jgi:medium-chain acyl-[acyl-carrier-protein] hydrolase
MQTAYQETFRIRSYDVDFRGDLKLNALFSYLQEIAGAHAEDLKVGYRDLKPLDLFWVLSRIKLRIDKYPQWHDTIAVQTWPKGFHKLFALRDFHVLNENQEVLIAVTSLWILIDKKTMRPQRYDRLPTAISFDPDCHALTELPDKIKTPDSLIDECTHRVTVSEIDVNRHVNNTRYIEWILDRFDLKHHEHNKIQSIQVNFIEEVKYDNFINIRRFYCSGQNKTFYVDGLKDDGSPAFQSIITRS